MNAKQIVKGIMRMKGVSQERLGRSLWPEWTVSHHQYTEQGAVNQGGQAGRTACPSWI